MASSFYLYYVYQFIKQSNTYGARSDRVPVKCETKSKRNLPKRNEIYRNETKSTETKPTETKRNETHRNETKPNETKHIITLKK